MPYRFGGAATGGWRDHFDSYPYPRAVKRGDPSRLPGRLADFAKSHQCRAPSDPVTIANASLEVGRLVTHTTTMELGRKFLSSLGIGGDTAVPPSAAPRRLTGANGRQAVEYVIRLGA